MLYEKTIDITEGWGDCTLEEIAVCLNRLANDLNEMVNLSTVELHEDFDPSQPVLLLTTEDPIAAEDYDFEVVETDDDYDEQGDEFDLFD